MNFAVQGSPSSCGAGCGDPPDASTTTPEEMLLVWPLVQELLLRLQVLRMGTAVLDFNCGRGHRCQRLELLGVNPVGLDRSAAAIEEARLHAGPNTQLRVGGIEALKPADRFSAIVSIMSLPFAANPEPLLQAWARHLSPEGCIVVAVYNPGYVRELLRAEVFFRDFDSLTRPRQGLQCESGQPPRAVTIRYAEEYSYLFEQHGLQQIYEARPPFSAEFLRDHPQTLPTTVPKYLVMGFRPKRP